MDINSQISYKEQNHFTNYLKKVIDRIGTTNKFFVEFGFADIIEPYDNTVFLKNNEGWNGLWMDIEPYSIEYYKNNIYYPKKLKQEDVKIHKITAENINILLEYYNTPEEPDLMIIDIDFNDFWVWRSMNFKPRFFMIEYNLFINPKESLVVEYDPDFKVDGSKYFGASFEAMLKLGKEKDYELIGCERANMFFVQKKLIDKFDVPNDIYSLYQPPHPDFHKHFDSDKKMIFY